MEANLKGTETEKNLMTAFAGESQARNKYSYFASKAKKDGFEQIAAIFEETANNEKEHAKMWFKELGGIGTTEENLKAAAEGENYEWTDMYKGFAETKDSKELHFYLKKWLKSKKNMKKDIANYYKMSKMVLYFQEMETKFGNVATVDIS